MSNRLAETNATRGNNTWHHIPTHLNPADHGTRGLKPTGIESKWLAAPSFLMLQSSQWPLKFSVTETPCVHRNNRFQILQSLTSVVFPRGINFCSPSPQFLVFSQNRAHPGQKNRTLTANIEKNDSIQLVTI